MADPPLTVTGTGVCLPAVDGLPAVAARLAAGRELAGVRRIYRADQTDLPPVDMPVGLCGEVRPPGRIRVSGLPRESQLALCAAADALAAVDGVRGDEVGVVWVSSTAGLEEYGQTCVAAATLPPGQASPLTAPGSAYNGPASAVSIRLALTGPQMTVTGDRDAGATALFEAGRLLDRGRCRYVLVGGSASLGPWRLAAAVSDRVAPPAPAPVSGMSPPPPAPGPQPAPAPAPHHRNPPAPHHQNPPGPWRLPGVVPAEGGVCLVLTTPAGVAGGAGSGARIRPLWRARLRPPRCDGLAGFMAGCLARMGGPPDAVTLAAAPTWRYGAERVLRDGGTRGWCVERSGGDLGAASGLAAVLAAVAACQPGAVTPAAPRVLALAVGDAGDAVAVEVTWSLATAGNVPGGEENRDESM